MTKIVIDAGHGGTRPEGKSTPLGAVGPTGLKEKDVTLEVARRLAPRFGGAGVLTRSADENLSLGRRIAIARGTGADAFLSIHASGGPPDGRGTQVWVHERGSENCAALGRSVAAQLVRFGAGGGEVRRGALAVLSPDHHARDTAACLVELDGLSDAKGERRLRDPAALEVLADVLARGLRAIDGYGRGGAARALESLDEKWPSRPAKVIPNETISESEQIDYTTDVLEALHAIFGVNAWDDLVSAGEKEAEEKLNDLFDVIGHISEPMEAAGRVWTWIMANTLGRAYFDAGKYHAKKAAREGFCTGIVWTADDRVPTDIKRTHLWARPAVNANFDEALPRIARNCQLMGLFAGMAAGKQLTATQKNNLFSDLRVRDYKARDPSGFPATVEWERWWGESWEGGERPEDFYLGASVLFEKHHLEPFDG
jgi:hypothetical protein